MVNTPINTICINNLELFVYLGWAAKELAHGRKVSADIAIQFAELPKACITDDLTDTICYDTLIQEIHKHISEKKFHLLEHFAYALYQTTKSFVAATNISIPFAIKVCVTKYPQIDEYPQLGKLHGGASFCCGDPHFGESK
jgi:dihydroneopterin aldolase